ncbi:hypothetical protein H696_05742 [Fonticula alba]|uniref:Uncharacterized protein n=1 Tax=Fonticula alba TaxID=691883 RepID=A0A058Z0L5_FONAL|nr:hypothetical protein H696_05742 [Fonticula alba]KCV67800.1 hypothetical protein H696_05742 [Fonticula alba]|eukprot:XP_009497831.1 hypothetical protein H696_05742 [Fonticula alba]
MILNPASQEPAQRPGSCATAKATQPAPGAFGPGAAGSAATAIHWQSPPGVLASSAGT